MNEELCLLPATALRELIARREVSPVEIVDAVLARAERLQPELNCFVTLCGDRARDEAKRAQAQIAAGEPLGLLHGIPFSVKDLVETKDLRTTFGAVPYKDNVPTRDAVSVARLRASGAILIGKTTTPEFGSKPLTDSPLFGRTRNAWDAGRTSGGSSGGAAVAIAAGIAPLAVATDGGGSTRIPAACNGVVGIKQTAGVIPHSQAQDAFGNQTYVTPTTRTVADTVLMMQVMSGGDPVDPLSIGLKDQDFAGVLTAPTDLRGCRVRFCDVPAGRFLSADVRAAFEKGLSLLADLGAELIEMPGEGFDVEPTWRAVNHTVWRARFGALVREKRSMLSETFCRQVDSASTVSGLEYQQAMFDRTALFRRVQMLLDDADIIATPTVTRTALPIGQDLFDPIEIDGRRLEGMRTNWYPWTMPYNMTGHPAVSMPCGFGSDGLPIGIQFVGRFREDAQLLRIARAFETTQPFEMAPV
jgi:aspartyl-tRNA(Asn)/glutamyl-tRNA(Gln) amidotransferase subunit A